MALRSCLLGTRCVCTNGRLVRGEVALPAASHCSMPGRL